jgi:hypothetical protein
MGVEAGDEGWRVGYQGEKGAKRARPLTIAYTYESSLCDNPLDERLPIKMRKNMHFSTTALFAISKNLTSVP